jgi:hypothetical protein
MRCLLCGNEFATSYYNKDFYECCDCKHEGRAYSNYIKKCGVDIIRLVKIFTGHMKII